MFFDWVGTIRFLYLCFGLPAVESKIWNRKVAIFFLWRTTGTISIKEQPKEGLGVVFAKNHSTFILLMIVMYLQVN